MITMVYNYTLKLANGQYLSLLSDDSVFSVLKEHPGAQFISRNEYGYKTIIADQYLRALDKRIFSARIIFKFKGEIIMNSVKNYLNVWFEVSPWTYRICFFALGYAIVSMFI